MTDVLVRATLQRIEAPAVVEHYIQDRAENLSAKGYDVVWYEVGVERDRHGGRFTARVTAHQEHTDIVAVASDTDEFLVVRDVFDVLSHRLWHARDVRKGREYGGAHLGEIDWEASQA